MMYELTINLDMGAAILAVMMSLAVIFAMSSLGNERGALRACVGAVLMSVSSIAGVFVFSAVAW